MAFSALKALFATGSKAIAKGYWCGGGFTNLIDGINFLTEATVNPSAVLVSSRIHIAGSSSLKTGYTAGGEVAGPAHVSEIDGLTFADETANNPAATLSVGRSLLGGVSSFVTQKGYYFGGIIVRTDIDGINFTTEAAINPSAALKAGRQSLAGGNTSEKGYFVGGHLVGGVDTNEIESFVFSTEAILDPTATLSLSRGYLSGNISSRQSLYLGGGSIGIFSPQDDIQKMVFSSETTSTLAALMAANIFQTTGLSGVTGGFWGGGLSGAATADIQGIFYSNDALNAVSANLADGARSDAGGIQPWPQY